MGATKDRKSGKVGRPKSSVAKRRISPYIPEEAAIRMERAMALRGMKQAEFVAAAVERFSREILEEEEVWKLRGNQAQLIGELLLNPREATSFAKETAQKLANDVEIRS